MQYRSIDIKNAEDILQKMVNQEHNREFFRNVSERNGVKSVCDGCRAAVVLPEGVPDWHLHDAYFETGDETTPKFDLNTIFKNAKNNSFYFELSKNQAEDFKTKLDLADDKIVSINIDKMEIEKRETALESTNKPDERIISFNPKYLKEALNFIMCSDDEYIEIYYTGNDNPLVMKSSRLYALILSVRLRE